MNFELKEGMVLVNHTCDAIDPITLKEYNPHDEKVVISQIKGDSVRLFNLTTSCFEPWRPLKHLVGLIRLGGYSITNERA